MSLQSSFDVTSNFAASRLESYSMRVVDTNSGISARASKNRPIAPKNVPRAPILIHVNLQGRE
jgi:hypothetical protein